MKRKPAASRRGAPLHDDPLWYKDAILYELRVRSWRDSNGDGIGDLPGLTESLDYLADLGVTALWLLPVCPSPGRDDGYDIADYTDVHPDIGTLDDMRRFLDEAHRRGLRVITELVLNHTSDQHPWFQRARRAAPGSPERDFYVWSDTPDKYQGTRIIFKDFEPSNWSWDPVAKQYFWHRFYSHQPDLNFDNPAVHDACLQVLDFWFGLGVDGLRLDAVPYLYEREGTNCENLAETHEFLKKLRRHVDGKWKNRMLLAEANQWPEDAAAYYGTPEAPECHMNFHFPIMPRLYMSIHMEDRLPIIDILDQTPQLDERSQWALFLRNHDELTLEMVTDEERDYMYRAFARETRMRINLGIRRRLAPLVGNNRRNIELMNGLLFSLPGTPVLYYGDEIGMGDNFYLGDRNGVRTPMQWSPDRNAGFSRANPQRLILPVIIDPEYHYEALNVEAQQQNPNSLLWWTKRLIALRKRFQAFGRGTIEFLSPENPRVLAFVRRYENETVLVVANLSRRPQYVELDLSKWKGKMPIELFGRTEFPTIGELPYLLTFGEHAFYWFSLEDKETALDEAREAAYVVPVADVSGGWESLFQAERATLEAVLPGFIEGRRWYVGRDRELQIVQVIDVVPLAPPADAVRLVIVRAEYGHGEPEHYVLPLAIADGAAAADVRARAPGAVLAGLKRAGQSDAQAVLYDALADPHGATGIYQALHAGISVRGAGGTVAASLLRGPLAAPGEGVEPRHTRKEHVHAAIVYGNSYVLKFYRRLEEGQSPELEIARTMAARGLVTPTAQVVAALEYRLRRGEPITLATLLGHVVNEGTAWEYTREELRRYYERALAASAAAAAVVPAPRGCVVDLAGATPPSPVAALLGTYGELARVLGRHTAELHRALASVDDPAFAPEPYSALDQRSMYQGKRNVTGKVLRHLRTALVHLPPSLKTPAQAVLAAEKTLYRRYDPLLERRLTLDRIRVHGDYHLGSVLWTGKDFVILDLEGMAGRPLVERRRKRAALRDVASMLRSFEYAVWLAWGDESVVREADRAALEPWARAWAAWVPAAFLDGYLRAAEGAPFLPEERGELAMMLDLLLIEQSLDDLGEEIDRKSDLALIALRTLALLLAPDAPSC